MHYLSYVLVYSGGNNHWNICSKKKKKKNLESLIHLKLFFFYGINSRKYLFSFPGQFGLVIGTLIPIRQMGKHHLLQPQVIGASLVPKWTTLHFLKKWKRTWNSAWQLHEAVNHISVFLPSIWEVLWNERVIILKGSHY